MSQGAKDLEPGTLYITIAIPQSPACHAKPSEIQLGYPLSLPADFDPTTYETWCADTYDREEFDWGLYWHRGPGDGTWYGLGPVDYPDGMSGIGMPAGFPQYKYTLVRRSMSQSPRLRRHVAGLIRVLHVPGAVARELGSYLDWLAAHAAATATRSFIWTTSLYLRTRRHIMANPQDRTAPDEMPLEFDITGFLCEALHFAYEELRYGLGGQLPRPILVSAYGMDLAWSPPSAGKSESRRRLSQRRAC